MRPFSVLKQLWAVSAALLILLFAVPAIHAHGGRTVGPYQFVTGFREEPAVEGQQNGVELSVFEGEESNGVAVEGLEETLHVEIIRPGGGESEVLALHAVLGKPGHYTANWTPPAAGEYQLRFFGTVGEMEIDEIFDTGPETFPSVLTAAEASASDAVPSGREIQGAALNAQAASADPASASGDIEEQADFMHMATLILAAVAFVVGIMALFNMRTN